MYQTHVKALLTLVVQSLMLVFLIAQTLSLINFESNTITQFKMYDSRSYGEEINFDRDAHGVILFGFVNVAKGAFVPPDPTICTF